MLKRNFTSLMVEQMVNAVSRLFETDYEKETQKYLELFDEFLLTYYKIPNGQLEKLLEKEEEREELFTDEKLKNFQLKLFTEAGFAYLKQGKPEKMQTCLTLIDRIQSLHKEMYEFPHSETENLQEEIERLKEAAADCKKD